MTANTAIPTEYTQIKERIHAAAQAAQWSNILDGFTVVKKPNLSHYAKLEMDQVEVSEDWARWPYLSRIISSALLGAVGSGYTNATLPHQHKRAGQELMCLPAMRRWEILCAIATCHHQCDTKDYQRRNTEIAIGSFVWDGKKGYHPMKAEAIIFGAVRLDKHYHAGIRGGEVSEYTLLKEAFIDTNCELRKIAMPKGKITGSAHYAYGGDFIVE